MNTVYVDAQGNQVDDTSNSFSCAWCTLHNCSCKDKNYWCECIEPVKGHYDDEMKYIEERQEIL